MTITLSSIADFYFLIFFPLSPFSQRVCVWWYYHKEHTYARCEHVSRCQIHWLIDPNASLFPKVTSNLLFKMRRENTWFSTWTNSTWISILHYKNRYGSKLKTVGVYSLKLKLMPVPILVYFLRMSCAELFRFFLLKEQKPCWLLQTYSCIDINQPLVHSFVACYKLGFLFGVNGK